MPTFLARLLTALEIHPVLVDIGASGAPPAIWKPLARCSVYVGFDPDQREIHETTAGAFYRKIIFNRAVTSETERDHVTFYLTRSPFCSSTLNPDQRALANYLFAEQFTVENQVTVQAANLNNILSDLALAEIDWLKVDSQGTDLRLFNALQPAVRSRVLALDIEPGLLDAYRGEDLFIDAQRELMHHGFWLSRLQVEGAVRMRPATVATLVAAERNLQPEQIERSIRLSPGWVEARYLRTLEWAREHHFSKREYALLWTFAMLDRQFGFALDLAVEWEKIFGADEWSRALKTEPLARIRRAHWLSDYARAFTPLRLRRWLRQFIPRR